MSYVIKLRKEGRTKSIVDGADMLTILMEEPIFGGDEQEIMDGCLEFFVGGAISIASTTANFIMRTAQLPDVKQKVREVFKRVVVVPIESQGKSFSMKESFTFDTI